MVEHGIRGVRLRSWGALACGLALWLSPTSARAQTPPNSGDGEPPTSEQPAQEPTGEKPAEPPARERPWAVGITPENQTRARQLFEAGNSLLDEALFKVALDKYREAIELWDHPATRYNMVVCLINLDQPIEAYQSLEVALRWGPDPLEAELYAQALTYKRLLERQLVKLVVRCDQAGARVTLDGRTLIECPGEHRALVEAGKHQVSAAKPGFLPRTYRLNLVGGEQREILVELMSIERATLTEQRWDRWKPWAVAGAGAALVLAGVPFMLSADANYESYDKAIDERCADVACREDALPPSVSDYHDRAKLQNRVAVGLFATGAVVAATGITMLVLNRAKTAFRSYPDEDSGQRALLPWADGEVVGLIGTASF